MEPKPTEREHKSVPAAPIILLRGLLRETRHWGDFAVKLQSAFPERPVIALDIAGNGLRYREPSATSIAAMVDDLRAQLQLNVSQPSLLPHRPSCRHSIPAVDIVAISMGGMIALEWMQRYPDEIHSAVLINTSLRKHSPFYHRLKWQQYFNVLRVLLAPAANRERLIFRMTTHQSSPALVGQWLKWREQCPVSARNALRQIYAASRYSLTLPPTQPTLLITSAQDALVDTHCSQVLANAWHTPILTHRTAGHDLPADDPDWLIESLLPFFRHGQAWARAQTQKTA